MLRTRMILLLAALVAAPVLALFLYWMGWGQLGPWDEVSGWAQLPSTLREMAIQNRHDFESEPNAPQLHWRGHATMEIAWQGQRFVIDPVASARINVAPRRFRDRQLDTTQRFDLILLSHAHMDHLDNPTLAQLPPARIVLPPGTQDFLSAAVRQRHEVVPLALGERITLGDLEIIPVPARHGGWRYPWQRGYTACGYIIRHQDKSLYLAGDTAMGPHFEAIARDFAPDYAVLPIGAYAPRWFLKSRHLNPEEAWQAAKILGVDYVVPYHFGTYRLSLEAMEAPLLRFAQLATGRRGRWLLGD